MKTENLITRRRHNVFHPLRGNILPGKGVYTTSVATVWIKGYRVGVLYLEFQNSLVIYDEIHAFQPRIAGLTLATARLLKSLGAKIAFASATFPEF